MIFIETTVFTKYLPHYLTDDEYRELQEFIMEQPDAGAIMQGTGGLRKLRWSLRNTSKRGGIRIVYYWKMSENQIYMMTLYSKNEMSNLSAAEKKSLKNIIERWQ